MEAKSGHLKMFISYSHKDESFLNELIIHLAMLKRSGMVKEWCDKELVVGDELDPEIEKHLTDAHLVAFLVSPDFIASWACYEVELKKTLDRINNSDVRVITIVVRHCDWKETELAKYLVAPKDGKPISKYEDRDEAWLEVAGSIKKAANKYLKLKADKEKSSSPSVDEKPIISEDFAKTLNDTELVFQHKHKEHIFLDDIFVYPDLKNIKQEFDAIERIVSSELITNHNTVDLPPIN